MPVDTNTAELWDRELNLEGGWRRRRYRGKRENFVSKCLSMRTQLWDRELNQEGGWRRT